MGVYHAPEDIITEDGLKIEVLSTSVNCPRYVAAGDLLTVHYTGYFLNGEVFESSQNVLVEKDPELPEEELNWNFDDGNSGFNPGTENDVQGDREGRYQYHNGKGKGRGRRAVEGEPLQFVIGKFQLHNYIRISNNILGKRKVILGWDQGLIGKCVHDKLRLTIPPQLAYGEDGDKDGIIPPGATLMFDIEILNVEDGEAGEAGFIKL